MCDKGEHTSIFLTRARAEIDGVPIYPDGQYVGLMHPDGDELPNFGLSFLSLESVQVWMREMRPRTVAVLCAADEDVAELQAAILEADTAGSVH